MVLSHNPEYPAQLLVHCGSPSAPCILLVCQIMQGSDCDVLHIEVGIAMKESAKRALERGLDEVCPLEPMPMCCFVAEGSGLAAVASADGESSISGFGAVAFVDWGQ